MPPVVSLVVPTQRRPGGLETAVRSLFAQTGLDLATVELIVADNDAVPSAQPLIEALTPDAPLPVTYVHEPRAGVANVRNAALAVARGQWIAFLDDDEEAPAGWLADLMEAQALLGADVVFGPVRGRAPEKVRHRAYLEDFFSRHGPADTRLLDSWYGCGNSLIRRAALPHPTAPFDPSRNASGGEDDLLFAQMANAGASFGWAHKAFVWEDPVPARLTLAYALRRAFAYGQGPSEHCAAEKNIGGILRWMLAGLVQTALWAPVVAIKWALLAPDRAMPLDRLMRGLGKTFWFPPFSQTFYGR
ncbi:glycosyltransferase [Caulobacter sp. SLTY]|uniref:glycosyltransferase family 2 protein n=1 Tax=Caulobacter sp. SLTY TaxID=2683262 RepID=UPI0014125B9B|nr:glycosyltransferase family 2 protein [Caulobacter sp. SLTY]NBB17499.1 glycosyltransferase [Caulobacter sp. SLTY]